MRIGFLCSSIPPRPTEGGSPRTMCLCNELAKNNQLYLACRTDDGQLDSYPPFSEVETLPALGEPSFLKQQLHRLLLKSHIDHRTRFTEAVSETKSQIRSWQRNNNLEVLHVFGLEASQFVPEDIRCPIVIDLVDALGLLFSRLSSIEAKPFEKFTQKLESFVLSCWERRLFRDGKRLVFIAPDDEAHITQGRPSKRTHVVPNGIDLDYFHPQPAERELSIVFTGVMSYRPNVDCAVYFAKQVFPLLKRRFSKLIFYIVGKDPSAEVTALNSLEGVVVTGTVDDIRPYVWRSMVYVSPLRAGAGMKNKVLAAMAMKTPVVASPLSLDGIDARPDRDVLVAESEMEFVKMTVSLLEDAEMRAKLSDSAYQMVSSKYSWASSAAAFQQIYLEELKASKN